MTNNNLKGIGFLLLAMLIGSTQAVAVKWIGGNYVDTCGNSVSIDEIQYSTDGVSVYPNPFSTSATLKFPEPLKEGLIVVYDCLGRMIEHKDNVRGLSVTLYGYDFIPGIYFYNISDRGAIIGRGKFVVQ